MSFNGQKREYRINSVAQLTGVPAGTLRAWERRYGVPTPRRTDTAYRVYTESDVAIIRRIQELCNTGMSVGEAAKLALSEQEQPVALKDENDPYQPLCDALLDAVSKFDIIALDNAIQRTMVMGSARIIFERVIRPVMVEVGDRWHSGEFTIGQEHLASTALEGATRRLLTVVARPDVSRRILLACFADETHTLPVYGIAINLAEAGYNGVVLGSRTPPDAIRQAVRELQPLVVGLSVTIAPEPHVARALVDGYADACGDVPFVIGGQGAEELRKFAEARGGVIGTNEPRTCTAAIEKLARVQARR